jgi:hypothetical protein
MHMARSMNVVRALRVKERIPYIRFRATMTR